MPSLKRRDRCLVYLVEPHPIAACHLATALGRNTELKVVVSDLSLSGDVTSSDKPSILIVDAGALPFPLAPFLRTVRTRFADARILVIGRRVPDDDLCRLLFEGASGFVSYEEAEHDLCAAVDALRRGHMWYLPQTLERYATLSSALEKQHTLGEGGLSPREIEVLGLLQRALSSKEIGGALGISERTVGFHLQNIFEKLGVHDRYSAMESARPAGASGPGRTVPVCKAA